MARIGQSPVAKMDYLSTDDWPPAQRLQTIMLEPLETAGSEAGAPPSRRLTS